MKYPLIVASSIVAADILVWRARLPPYERTRLFIRLALFAALSWLLFSADMSPFGEPPYRDAAGLHWLAQILEIIWWLMGARLLTLSLDLLLLPRSWRKQRLFSDVFGAIVFLAAAVAALAFVLELPVRGLVATSGALAIVLGLARVPLRALGVPAPAAEAGDARLALLKRVSLFESLDAAEVAQLAKRLSRHEYRANQEILAPDTVPDSLAIVYTGVLSVVFREASGERELARVGPGEAFGEAGLLAGLPMRVSITTLTPAVLFQLGKDDMSAFLKAHPEVAEKLCQLLAYRQDKLGKLTAALPAEQEHGHSLFDWLFGKMRHVHSLHD